MHLQVAKLPFYLSWGTLLGAMRGAKHIPHETDIDLSVDRAAWKANLGNLTRLLRTTHFVLTTKWPTPRLFYSKGKAVHVDLWLVDRWATTTDEHDHKRTDSVENAVLYPFSPCAYEGHAYDCPRDAGAWLAMTYGADWRTPRSRTPATEGTYHQSRHGRVNKPKMPCKVAPWSPGNKAWFDRRRWDAFAAAARALARARAPYRLHGGTLLGFARDCDASTWDLPLDFALPRAWRAADGHAAALAAALAAEGFAQQPGKQPPQQQQFVDRSWAWTGKPTDLPDERVSPVPVALYLTSPAPADAADAVDGGAAGRGDVSYDDAGRACRDVYDGVASYDWAGVEVRAPVPPKTLAAAQWGPRDQTYKRDRGNALGPRKRLPCLQLN